MLSGYQRYLERVERVKQFTTVYLVADNEFYRIMLVGLSAESDDKEN